MENSEIIKALNQQRGQVVALLTQTDALLAALAPPAAPTPAPVPVGRPPENPTGTVAGLNYAYYEGNWQKLPDFATLKPVASGSVLQLVVTGFKRSDLFGLRHTGFLYVPADGEYTFYLVSDDGARLSIGNTVVVDNDGLHGAQEKTGKILLQKGVHAITLDYFNGSGDKALSLSYSSAILPKTPIPAAAYSRPPAAVANLTAQAK